MPTGYTFVADYSTSLITVTHDGLTPFTSADYCDRTETYTYDFTYDSTIVETNQNVV